MINSKIQEYRIFLFLINHFVNCWIFHLKLFISLKTFNSELSYIEVWFIDQNSKPLDTEDRINIILVIN